MSINTADQEAMRASVFGETDQVRFGVEPVEYRRVRRAPRVGFDSIWVVEERVPASAGLVATDKKLESLRVDEVSFLWLNFR